MVKSLPASTEDVKDQDSIPESERSPGGGHATHSSILASKIPWTEECDRLVHGVAESDTTERLHSLTH